jgi:Arsenical resistance operon protein ArsD
VCGTSVDAALASFAGDLEWLAGNGIPVRRHNLGQEPGVFAERDRVRTMLQEDGQDCLPIVIVEGSVRSTGR